MSNEALKGPDGLSVSAHVMDVADMIDAAIALDPDKERHQLVADVTMGVFLQLDQHQRYELIMLKLRELLAPKIGELVS